MENTSQILCNISEQVNNQMGTRHSTSKLSINWF